MQRDDDPLRLRWTERHASSIDRNGLHALEERHIARDVYGQLSASALETGVRHARPRPRVVGIEPVDAVRDAKRPLELAEDHSGISVSRDDAAREMNTAVGED